MARILPASLALAAALMLARGVTAQTLVPTPAPEADPIADALAGPETKPDTKPAAPAIRVFSPAAIADLLEHEAQDPPPPAASPARALAASGKVALTPEGMAAVRFSPVSTQSKAVDPVVLKAEILLDRAHAPPGVIDGRYGSNFTKAIGVFETTHGLPVDGKLSQAVWDALGGDTAGPVLGTYVITPEDAAKPFYPDLPTDYALLAKLPESGYHSPAEMLGERFHMDKRFLQALNPEADLGLAGTTIIVAEVSSLPLVSQIARIDVDKAKGQVQAYDAQDNLVTAYPATIGSEELPSPSGSYAVRAVAWHPTYSYDPKKNFQQGTNTQRLTLPAGPNNPVGSVFIALTKPTFGIHGTPDPTKIDKTHSHGCVRLTNWNAEELAHLVRPGIPVNFIDKPGAESKPGDTLEDVISSMDTPGR
ncbi:MAG: L,D-transpeptidase [Beijerinckiaceae bacterium]